jgi:ribose/xylose/arabinose/galactoside ABC-type transport system permease subunit
VLHYVQEYGALTALVGLFIFNALTSPGFLSAQSLLNVQLRQAAPVAIVALGMALVIATRGIDLSVGSTMALAGQVGAMTVVAGASPVVGVATGLLAAALVGLFNGSLVSALGVQPIIATLILFIAGRGVAQLLTNGQLVNVRNPTFEFLGLGAVAGVPFQVVVFAIVWVTIALVIRFTPYGRYLVATGANEPAARLAGIPVRTVKFSAYLVVAMLAGMVGLMEVGRVSASDANNTGLGMELDAIAAVAVAGTPLTGGRITPTKVVVGALMLRLLQNTLIAKGIPKEVAQIAQGGIIIAAVLVQRRNGGRQ